MVPFFNFSKFKIHNMPKCLISDSTDQNAPHIKNVPVLHSSSFWYEFLKMSF